MKQRAPSYSKVSKMEVVCPNDTNPMGILQGGRLVQWMDIAAAVCAQTHSGKICVTACIDMVCFMRPALVGEIVTIEARITRSFTTSMEIMVSAWSKSVLSTKKHLIAKSYFTFVAKDEGGEVSSVVSLKLETKSDYKHYEEAGKRRENRSLNQNA